MVKWLKKLWCRLTGGHIYADAALQCCHCKEERKYIFRNRCVKCGELDVFELPYEKIAPHFVRIRSPFYVECEEGDNE